ncbi:ETC complex I subunit [Hyphobacterium marinum]|uniref:ETC complex I subunit n=1 Tax=Hyphobacterium marinum TaxID=3116574 RepID=A0ABU7LYP1_9PROT|nr:ETC complex I subunit [Hyphobacterium sp. Y6023]MEE2566645.1 ETC complex I subunit [Hyphobacterium sp. Y6023]
MFAKIYRPSRNVMQSGRAKTRVWLLDFDPATARRPDPLMGWTSSTDTNGQVRLKFDTKEAAIAYARKHGIAFQVTEKTEPMRREKSYAANFAPGRKEPWSH